MNTDMIAYYRDRAKEYDKVHLRPERQEYLQKTAELLQEIFSKKSVLEIACGTGYWTEKIARTATSVFAFDINETVLEVAKQRDFPRVNVTFEIADMYNFHPEQKYEALLGGFIWSHIPLQDLDKFLQVIHSLVMPGSPVVFIDNTYLEGVNHRVTQTDELGNTYQTRKLDNGTQHLVLKNFPSEEFLREKIKGVGKEIRITQLKYYWILSYNTLS